MMFTLIAALVFAVMLFGGHIGTLALLPLGLLCLALGSMFDPYIMARLPRRA